MKNLLPFEKKVFSGLFECGISFEAVSVSSPLGIAVSGGADSVSLLLSLASIFDYSCLRVITVDHGIRSEIESGGDADFVRNLCEKLSVKCKIVKIPHGKITAVSEKSSLSIEAVAREFRYKSFDSFLTDENLCALCLAHNQNDMCETLLMRFLQGSGTEGMGGIDRVRGKIIRPLLEISRSEIEAYLREKNQSWRTDATNSETKYLRNRIRNVLVPVLNENFSGWQKSVLSASKKAFTDEDYFKKEVEVIRKQNKYENSSVKIDRTSFFDLHPALKRRVFFASLNEAGFGGRFPFKVFEEILSYGAKKSAEISFENVRIFLNPEKLEISLDDTKNAGRKSKISCIETGFFFLFNSESDSAELEGVEIQVSECLEFKKAGGEKISVPVAFPFAVRNPLPGDEIKTSDGKYKLLSEIFTDWKIPESQRNKIIVVEELNSDAKNPLRAALAFHLGFKNWIVE